jgi:hypothetical protein
MLETIRPPALAIANGVYYVPWPADHDAPPAEDHPAVAAFGGKLYLLWLAEDSLYYSAYDGEAWTVPRHAGPTWWTAGVAVCAFNGRLLVMVCTDPHAGVRYSSLGAAGVAPRPG